MPKAIVFALVNTESVFPDRKKHKFLFKTMMKKTTALLQDIWTFLNHVQISKINIYIMLVSSLFELFKQ